MKKYRKRFIIRNILKSIIIGLLCSSAVFIIINIFIDTIIAAIIALGVFVSMAGLTFRFPDDRKIASEIDSSGDLAQRVITMNENKDKDSLIIRIQREDTIKKLNSFDVKKIKLISKPLLIITLILIAFSGLSVYASANDDSILNPRNIVNIIPVAKSEYSLSYECEGEGSIEGDMFQIVFEGEDGNGVYAVPEEGWYFVEWSDGYKNPYRQDKEIFENLTLIAYFTEVEEKYPDEDEDKNFEDGVLLNDLINVPDINNLENENDNSDNGMGGKYEDSNQVIDGDTYVGDVYDSNYEDAIEVLRGYHDMSNGVKGLIEDYYSVIRK